MAQSSCSNMVLSMASCLNYVTGASAKPPASFCSALANVVQTNPRCLCAVIDGGSQFGICINSTLALSLPAVCKVQTPPVSRCNGSKATPGSTATPSNGSVAKIHLQLFGFIVLLVSSLLTKFSCF